MSSGEDYVFGQKNNGTWQSQYTYKSTASMIAALETIRLNPEWLTNGKVKVDDMLGDIIGRLGNLKRLEEIGIYDVGVRGGK